MKIVVETVTAAIVLIHSHVVDTYIPPFIEPTPTTDSFPTILTALPTTHVK